MRRASALFAVGGLVLTSCMAADDDGGGVSAEEEPYVAAIAEQFTSTDAGELSLDTEQADCVSPRWVDVITVERFEEQGVTPEDIVDDSEDELPTLGLDDDQANGLVDAFGDCDIDISALLVEVLNGTGGSAADRECLSDEIDDDLVRRLLVVSLTEAENDAQLDPELEAELTAALSACGFDF